MADPPAAGAQLDEGELSAEFLKEGGEKEAKVPPPSSSLSSRVSGVAGGWGKWLLTSASSLVTELAAETVEAKNDLKEFCTVIASDSAAWVRRQTTGHDNADTGGSNSSKTTLPSSTVCMQEENNNTSGLELASSRAPATAGHTLQAASDAEAKAGNKEEKNKQEILPFWRFDIHTIFLLLLSAKQARADPLLHQQFSLMVRDEATFLSDSPSHCGASGRITPQDSHGRDCSTSASPTEEEMAEYLKDSDVSSAFARLVPDKVDEQLFWKRLHARVCLLKRGKKQVSVHPKMHPCSNAEERDSSESEEDITWEDLGSEEEAGSHHKTNKTQ
ncbi:hypothetical protein Emag_003808 [Eimeria magna]